MPHLTVGEFYMHDRPFNLKATIKRMLLNDPSIDAVEIRQLLQDMGVKVAKVEDASVIFGGGDEQPHRLGSTAV